MFSYAELALLTKDAINTEKMESSLSAGTVARWPGFSKMKLTTATNASSIEQVSSRKQPRTYSQNVKERSNAHSR